MTKPKSPAQKFHEMREFSDLGSLEGMVTRLENISKHPTTLAGEAKLLEDCISELKFLLSLWKDNSPRARIQFMERSK